MHMPTKLIVCKMDKNLGPAIMDQNHYIKLAFHDHLLDHNTYKQLTKDKASLMMIETEAAILRWLNHHKDQLSQAEITFLK